MLTPDQFAKNALREALGYACAAETEVEVLHATQKIDVYSFPDPARGDRRERMGLLGEFAAAPSLFEAFWNTPGIGRVRRCIAKQLAWHHELERRARTAVDGAAQTNPVDAPLLVVFPWLVILTTGQPNSVLEAFACNEVRPGIHEAARGLCLRIIVIRELPRTRETLLLRLIGRGQVFDDALEDFRQLPNGEWEKRFVGSLLRDFSSDGRHAKTNTNEEVDVTQAQQLQKLAAVYYQCLVREGEQTMLLRQLQSRFGILPPSVESRVRAAEEDELYLWGDRILRARTLEQVFRAPRAAMMSKASTT